ncbi:sarcosine oxidase subunit gamma [Microbacterium sp.]|uniref:sarcosine oxidase subunit gamma n=1 Tax=Microbacterium sp. TaxID=51671 RepID=UPI0039E431FD
MADLDGLRIAPAAHLADAMDAASAATSGTVSLREIAFAVQLGLRAHPESASARALSASLGVPLPRQVGHVSGDPGAVHIIWISPDEFLAVDTSRRRQPDEAAVAEAALRELPGQVVDLSANRAILELTGIHARDVLEKGCRADLHPRAFSVGSAWTTQLAQVPLILHHAGENSYRLFPRASFADYTVRWLIDAMAEYAV